MSEPAGVTALSHGPTEEVSGFSRTTLGGISNRRLLACTFAGTINLPLKIGLHNGKAT